MSREKTLNSIAFLFALLFSYAAISKLLDIGKFQVELGQSPMLTSIAIPLSWSVPFFELVIAIGLFQPVIRRLAFYACLSVMVVFTTYVVIIMNYAHHVPCSCGGILQKMSWQAHFVFNTAFVILAIVGVVIQENMYPTGGVRQSSTANL